MLKVNSSNLSEIAIDVKNPDIYQTQNFNSRLFIKDLIDEQLKVLSNMND